MHVEIFHDDSRVQRAWARRAILRAYLRRTPVRRGRGWLHRRLANYPTDGHFSVRFNRSSSVQLRYDEALGIETLMFGEFEGAEIRWAANESRYRTVFDVGANVGYFAAAIASDPTASVVAIEPLEANLSRLGQNIGGLSNVRIIPLAVSEQAGTLSYEAPPDGAFASVSATGTEKWTSTTLDQIWDELGCPPIHLIKMDIEGHEPAALRGAARLLAAQQPLLLLEAWADGLSRLDSVLKAYSYVRVIPALPRFLPWNHIYRPAATC